MSQTSTSHAGLTRRSFLKTTGLVAGATALSSAPLQALAEDYAQGQVAAEGEQIFQGVCRGNCFAACPLNVHVREGKIVKTSPAQFPNPEFNRICAKGLSHPYRVYSPDRLQYPMRRVEGTERGAGEWERVTWEEAVAEIAEKWTAIQAQYGPQALAKWAVSGNYATFGTANPVYSRLFNLLNASSIGAAVDMGNAIGFNRVLGWAGVWVMNEAKDMKNAKTAFVWSNNITDAQAQEWHFVADAIEAGTEVICIDPVFTQLAAKSSRWVPIKPATDAALALGMVNVLLEEGLQNEEFLAAHTVAPYLVNTETGLFVRLADTGVEPELGADGNPINPCMVMQDGELVAIADATNPDIWAECELNGVACKSALVMLKEDAADYAPEAAAAICDVPADTIRELARKCIDGPVTHRVGWGSQAYDNGVHPSHAIACIAALTGQIGFAGASAGSADINGFMAADGTYATELGVATSSSVPILDMPELGRTGKWMGNDYPIKAAFVVCGNPLATASDSNAIINDVIGNMEFLVTVDNNMTDTAQYSDLVLPCAEWFEFEDVCSSGQHNFACLNEKAIEPLYESKTDSDIARMIAEALGLGEHFSATDEEILERTFSTDACVALGMTFPEIREKKIVRHWPAETKIAFEGNTFLTASGRMEFYVEAPTPMGLSNKVFEFDASRERLPHYFPPAEAYDESPLHETYPFVLMSERPRYRVHSQFGTNKWLRELDPVPTVKMNPADAAAKGLEDGATVEVFNDRGHAVCQLVYNEAIRPGCMVYPKSWPSKLHKAGSWAELPSLSYDPVNPNQGFMDVLVDVRLWEEEA